MLTFNDAAHEYRWQGRPVPSVTQLLQHLHSFAGVPLDVLEDARMRGTYVHKLCEAYDLGTLDEPLVPNEYQGYLAAWKAFIKHWDPVWLGIERMGYSEQYGFAGTEDRHALLRNHTSGTRFGLDIKTSAQKLHRVTGLQLAAYRQIRIEKDPLCALDRRATVQLSVDGKYKFQEWNNPRDWFIFQSLLNIIQWSAE